MSLQSCEWRVGLGILPFLDRIDRSSSQATAVHVGGRVISTTSWNVFCSSPSPIVLIVFRVSIDDSSAAFWIFLR